MSISIYLYFDGQCAAAFDHYLSVFNGQEICRQTYADGPSEFFGDTPLDRIMHATIQIKGAVLMGSDRATNCDAPIVKGDNFAITIRPDSKMEADRMLVDLAQGGEITMPMQDTFWGSYFGLCTDRFGIHWMINFAADSNET